MIARKNAQYNNKIRKVCNLIFMYWSTCSFCEKRGKTNKTQQLDVYY